MANKVNTMSQCFIIFAAFFLFAPMRFVGAQSLDPNADAPSVINPTPKQSSKDVAPEELRRIQVIQIPSQQLNFKYSNFKTAWLTSENSWQSLWKESRNDGTASSLSVNWKTESVLAIFWPSKDDVVRIPAFSGSEVVNIDGANILRLYFNLNSPCFGIITDVSPAQLIIMDRNMSDIDRVVIHSDNTRSTGCF